MVKDLIGVKNKMTFDADNSWTELEDGSYHDMELG